MEFPLPSYGDSVLATHKTLTPEHQHDSVRYAKNKSSRVRDGERNRRISFKIVICMFAEQAGGSTGCTALKSIKTLQR